MNILKRTARMGLTLLCALTAGAIVSIAAPTTAQAAQCSRTLAFADYVDTWNGTFRDDEGERLSEIDVAFGIFFSPFAGLLPSVVVREEDFTDVESTFSGVGEYTLDESGIMKRFAASGTIVPSDDETQIVTLRYNVESVTCAEDGRPISMHINTTVGEFSDAEYTLTRSVNLPGE